MYNEVEISSLHYNLHKFIVIVTGYPRLIFDMFRKDSLCILGNLGFLFGLAEISLELTLFLGDQKPVSGSLQVLLLTVLRWYRAGSMQKFSLK